jgi:hypothetical protein
MSGPFPTGLKRQQRPTCGPTLQALAIAAPAPRAVSRLLFTVRNTGGFLGCKRSMKRCQEYEKVPFVSGTFLTPVFSRHLCFPQPMRRRRKEACSDCR